MPVEEGLGGPITDEMRASGATPPAAATSNVDGSSSGGSSNEPASSADTPKEDEAASKDDEQVTVEELIGVPPGGQLVQTGDGRVYWTKMVPGTSPPAYVSYYISDPDDLDTILGGRDFAPVRFETEADLRSAGYFDAGSYEEIEGSSNDPAQDPFDTFVVDLTEQMEYSPMFGDPEIMALIAEATLEGRDVSDAELRATDYWLSRTDEQRAWDELVAAGLGKNNELPAEARQQVDTNTKLVRQMLTQAGMENPPDSLVKYLAMNFTDGTWNQSQLEMQIEAETDPYSPNASPFAGKVLGSEHIVVRDQDGNMFVRTRDQGDKRLTGPGQEARYGGSAVDVNTEIPAGRHVVGADGNHYFENEAGELFIASGDGQVAGLQRLYGDAERLEGQQVPSGYYLRPTDGEGEPVPEVPVAGSVVDLFGGPGGIEQYGAINETGTASEVLVDAHEGSDMNSALGEVERVRTLVRNWLGPVHGDWDQGLIEEWAGKLRQNSGQEEVLVSMLRNQRQGLFPDYDEDLRYVDIAAPWEQMFSQYWGRGPRKEDEFFNRIINLNDGEEARKLLMREGFKRGNQTVLGQIRQSEMAAFGGANDMRSVL